MTDSNFKGTVEALFHGIEGVVTSKTVVGDAIHIGDTIILPLVDVSFAVGAGAWGSEKKDKGAGGIDPMCSSCYPEWADKACECEESGYDYKDSGYGS